ncbi:Sodium/Potassium-Transporting Atpase Subunit Beta-2 [Manis pentadactyla]|nr:Sodium/Potassium-Transporting Atpase Subunit Beta-2 [Manis pentadactyla]
MPVPEQPKVELNFSTGIHPLSQVKLACGVQQENQTTDGQRDKSVRKDWASLRESVWSPSVDKLLKKKPVGGLWAAAEVEPCLQSYH